MKRLILYDLDGTLVDTREDIVRTVRHVLVEMGRPPMSDAQIAGQVGKGLPYLIRHCLGTDDSRAVDEGLRLYRAFYRQHMLDHTRLYPDVRSVLEFFGARTQAVITNKSEASSRALLQTLGIGGCFREIVGGDSGFPYKPDPAGTRALMARHGARPDDTLLIGDSLIDVDTGRNAGIATVIVTHGFGDPRELADARPQELVADFRELLAAAHRAGW